MIQGIEAEVEQTCLEDEVYASPSVVEFKGSRECQSKTRTIVKAEYLLREQSNRDGQ